LGLFHRAASAARGSPASDLTFNFGASGTTASAAAPELRLLIALHSALTDRTTNSTTSSSQSNSTPVDNSPFSVGVDFRSTASLAHGFGPCPSARPSPRPSPLTEGQLNPLLPPKKHPFSRTRNGACSACRHLCPGLNPTIRARTLRTTSRNCGPGAPLPAIRLAGNTLRPRAAERVRRSVSNSPPCSMMPPSENLIACCFGP
jgi:hypothetical protein